MRAMVDDDEFLKRATETREVLKKIDPAPYRGSPIPSPEDELVARVVDLYVKAFAPPSPRQLVTPKYRGHVPLMP